MYVLLTGGVKNVGDYLITERARKLLEYHRTDREIVEISRYDELEPHLDIINSAKAVILCGGPGYLPNMYPGVFKLTKNLDDIKVPIIPMAMGWYGSPGDDASVYAYSFTDDSRRLLDRTSKDAEFMGCRDYLTSRVLNNNGYKNTFMTGCTAWYDIEYLEKEFDKDTNIKKVVFSTPAGKEFKEQSVDAMKILKNKFKDAEFYCAFHRGITPDDKTKPEEANRMIYMKEEAEKLGYEILDLSYDLSRMQIYDECDLHVGYRVHAHIYCLSHRKKTILLNEDGRGRGVCEATGLNGIQAYERKFTNAYVESRKNNDLYRIVNKGIGFVKANEFASRNLEYYLDELMINNFSIFDGIRVNMLNTYENMKKFIKILP